MDVARDQRRTARIVAGIIGVAFVKAEVPLIADDRVRSKEMKELLHTRTSYNTPKLFFMTDIHTSSF
ncbi:MAG: hypothetical protein U5K38_06645 [Woeseiaceae bacterium]|nr:hypothetical protein [Woeseiaceae bacterium]